jgi:hypothetical protein
VCFSRIAFVGDHSRLEKGGEKVNYFDGVANKDYGSFFIGTEGYHYASDFN